MAYRADIEIAVKGAQELKRFSDQIKATSKLVDSLNNYIENIGKGGVVRNLNNLRNVVNDAAAAFNKAALQTDEAAIAANNYYQANKQLNNGLRERIKLLQDLRGAEYGALLTSLKASKASRAQTGFGAFSAGIEGSIAVQKAVRRNRERLSRQPKAAIEAAPLMLPAYQERGLQILNNSVKLNESNLNLERALNGERARGVRYLEKQSAEEQRQIQLGLLGQRTNALRGRGGTKFAFPMPMEGPIPLDLYGSRRRKQQRSPSRVGGGRLGGAVSGAIIGGAFPLLFGQGQGAAAGGAIGGLVGGLAGPGGSFAGSLLGTLLGDIAERGKQIKELGADIGFSAEQTKKLQEAFKLAGQDADKFTAAVQSIRGLSLELEDQASIIQALTQLTSSYGGSIDKTSMAFTSALSSGKVTQATLNQLTSQNIPIQEKLAATYNVSRSELLQMAKDGKISVQDLADAFIDLANESAKGPTKIQSAYAQAFKQIELASGNLTTKIKDSLNIQVSEGEKAAETLALRVSKAFTDILKSIEPVVLLLATTTGAFINLGIQIGQALAGVPGMVSDVATALIGLLPGFGEVYQILAGIASLSGGKQRGGVASPLNLNQGMEASWPEGVPRPGTVPTIKDITAPSQMSASGGGKRDRGAAAAEREAERVAKVVREQRLITEERKRQFEFSQRIFAAEQARDPLTARRIQGEQQLTEWALETSKLIKNEKDTNAQLEIIKARIAEKNLIIQKTEQDITKLSNQRREAAAKAIGDLEVELAIRNATTQAERDRLRIEYEMAQLRKEKIYDEAEIARIQELQTRLAAPVTGADLIRQQVGGLSDEMVKLIDVGNQVTSVAESIGMSFGESFKGVISGSMTAQQALANFFQSVADHFLDMAAQIIAKWIQMTILNSILKLFPGGNVGGAGGNAATALGINTPDLQKYAPLGTGVMGVDFPTFANGGMPPVGRPSIVGERGPELFVPRSSGTIIPNDQLGGTTNVVVNVDAKGSNVQGDDSQAKALGSAISVAVQAEIVKQQRPGGLLAGTR